jgi:predicted nucleic-acid-binding Zn-ribbon protein
MTQAQAVEAKKFTDLTCWSCGEETLKEVVDAVDPNAFRPVGAIETAIMQSKCTKCGAQSINAAQAQINKVNARKSRKALIKETNRKTA